ncbi:MAG: tRNA ((37)-N6)-threonylcarbamoyltransferase complex ATPase subunit type 1 TsaE [Nocardioidaceae bacterium]|nr:tRNA ((37)-N6)-threonylcarbamoyltransferase complex ATPase subunit type 1 TsaE [Nocardioidaceae bacterium]
MTTGTRPEGRSSLSLAEVGPDRAAEVARVVHRAFGARPRLDPPSTAMDETVTSVAEALRADGGLLVLRQDQPVGALLFDSTVPGRLGLRRVSVDPAHQDHGVASAMVGVAEDVAAARGLDGVWLDARDELAETVTFWLRRGYVVVDRVGPSIRLAKTLELARALPTADDTREFGRRLAAQLVPGDLVVLTGSLGAGKTTLTQGIGAGLGVRGDVTSPTFVISRVHPSLTTGPELVHVDAYRLAGTAELDDLDLDASVADAVTVVEWGEGLAERLGQSWLDVRLDLLEHGGKAALAAAGPDRDVRRPPDLDPGEVRVITVRPRGPRWATSRLRSTLLA